MSTLATEITRPYTKACVAPILPDGIGRFDVRRMVASMSRSNHWLIAFAPPADRYPPIIVHSTF
jgi:hypothetical protein